MDLCPFRISTLQPFPVALRLLNQSIWKATCHLRHFPSKDFVAKSIFTDPSDPVGRPQLWQTIKVRGALPEPSPPPPQPVAETNNAEHRNCRSITSRQEDFAEMTAIVPHRDIDAGLQKQLGKASLVFRHQLDQGLVSTPMLRGTGRERKRRPVSSILT
jgi:hypothetical protein